MKIVFFGTSSFGLPSLEAIVGSRHSLSAVVTTPDRPRGRRLKILPSPVKEWALAHGQIVHEASPETILSLAPALQKMQADVFVVISFGIILPETIFEIPKKAALNVHSSLLPRHRGPAPIQWAILRGDATTGVTVMRLAAGLDTGDLLLQEATPISSEESQETLHERLAKLGAGALLRSLDLLEENKACFTPQNEREATYARKITKEDGKIRWEEPAQAIVNRVRALAGWPGAFTFFKGKRIILHRVSVASEGASAAPAGRILKASAEEGILVATQHGVLKIEKLQLEGKKPLLAAEFLSGHALKAGDVLE